MPYYAQLSENNIVVAVTQTSGQLPPSPQLVELDGLHADLCGQSYDATAGTFSPVAQAAAPAACTPAQGLVALYVLHGITEQAIHDAIAAIADAEQRYTAQIAFSRATEWRRNSPAMQIMANLLGLDGAELDALFAKAATVLV